MKALAVVGSLLCLYAGLYLVTLQAVGEQSLIQAIANGIGYYCLGKAFIVGPSLWLLSDMARRPSKEAQVEVAEEAA